MRQRTTETNRNLASTKRGRRRYNLRQRTTETNRNLASTKRGRSREDSRKGTTKTNRNLAALSYYYATRGTPPSNNGEICPVVPAENRKGEKEARERRKVSGGDASDKKFACQVEGCNYRAAHKGHLNQHMANKHDVGVVWHHCGINGCTYKAKDKNSVKQHKSDVHDIGVVWHHCDVVGCTFKSKQKGNLKRHKKSRNCLSAH